MTPADEILLTTILRRMLVANDDTAILADPFAGDLGSAALPEGAQHAAEVFGRTAAQAKRVVATAMKRLGV